MSTAATSLPNSTHGHNESTNTSTHSNSNDTTSSATKSNTIGSASAPFARPKQKPTHNHVSECLYEFLLSEILHWIEAECETPKEKTTSRESDNKDKGQDGAAADSSNNNSSNNDNSEQAILSAERAAAKIERLGFGVGYRLCERLAQFKPLATIHSQPPSSLSSETSATNAASHHLEAVKFLCKEFWMEVFRKQIDKLQTNHRGIFVLKDHELRWLKRFPSEDERARVAAIKMLAFPCGLIRGALSNLGIAAVVSCDFLADGKTMSACSFNIKIKT